MSAETELYAALSGQAGLTALVSTRIYPDAIPEGKPLPAVVYIRSSTQPTYTIGGVLVCEDVHFMITGWAESRSDADAVADEIAAALTLAGNPSLDRSGGFDAETGLFAASIECDWFWSS